VDAILGVNVDITQRKRAEMKLQKTNDELQRCIEQRAAELEQTNEELQSIYDGMVDGLLIAEVETKRFLRANASMCRMLGYTEEELLQMSVRDIHPPENVAADLEFFKARFEGRLSEVRTRPFLRKDGSVFYADIRASKIMYRGRACLVGFFRDATERIQAEQALRQERQILSNLLAASDRQRQLISYEIHDGLTQQLTGAIMQFQSYESLRALNPEDAARSYEKGVALLRDSLSEARQLIAGVRPPLLDDAGVVAAIENLIMELNDREGPEIQWVSSVDFERLQPVLENAIYRIVQESLTNACRHSGSPRIRVDLSQQGDCIQIEIRDWGVGFNPGRVAEGCFGLEGIRERARLLGGSTEIRSQLSQGTSIRVRLPAIVHAPQCSEAADWRER
jgi:PAS domain S-box-containing protein